MIAVSNAPLISLSRCSVVLDGHAVLDDVSFALRAGERWALVGPNGAGKTLLLKLLRGDVWPTPGMGERRTYRFGRVASEEPGSLKRLIAYIGPERQDKYVRYGWNLTVAEVVATGLFDEDIPLSKPSRSQRVRVARVMRRFGLWGLRGRRMLTLSYGQRRLALIARAFASDARVLLLDEVFNGLDARTREKLRRALERPRGGHEWVLTSHRPHELPHNVTHVARMEAGRILDATVRPHTTHPRGQGRRRTALGRPVLSSPSPGGHGRRRTALGRPGLSSPLPRRRGRVREGARTAGAEFIAIRNATLYRDYRPVIRNLDWTIARGEHWAVLGANGSGKSTLLNFIHGDLHAAVGGEIRRAGLARGARIEEWKRRVGWLSPELQADHYLARSIEEIVISGRYSSVGLNEAPTRSDRAHARRWLRFFGIERLRDRGPRQVSYGQMRLALIARAMVKDPQMLLLDEPCAGLDGDVRASVLTLIERLARNGAQLIMAVHDEEDIAASVRKVLRIGRSGKVSFEDR